MNLPALAVRSPARVVAAAVAQTAIVQGRKEHLPMQILSRGCKLGNMQK